MKKLCLFIGLALCSPALAQEGFSPTHPFGIKGMERQQAPVNNPYQNQYYNNGYGYGNYNYYYGPYGVYNNGYVRPYNQGSPRYKDPNHDRAPRTESYPSLPGYDHPLEQHAPPGY